MTITEKAAYIKGLADGLNLDETTTEGKLIAQLLSLVTDMSAEIADLQADITDLRAYVEELDDALETVEDIICEEDEDYDDYDEFEDDDYIETECPSCGEIVCFDGSLDLTDLTCPACGEKFECVIDCDGQCDGCTGCDDVEPEAPQA